jgi:hypothetical protein
MNSMTVLSQVHPYAYLSVVFLVVAAWLLYVAVVKGKHPIDRSVLILLAFVSIGVFGLFL